MHIPLGQKDVTLATAGTYTLDPNHVSVEARVSHIGFSTSIFRFGKAAATLQWDPRAIAKSKLDATVEVNSLMTNVAGFAEELQGDKIPETPPKTRRRVSSPPRSARRTRRTARSTAGSR